MSEELLLERGEGVATITINKPKANQLSNEVLDRFPKLLNMLSADKTIRVVVITNTGEKIFCAGADLKSGFGDLGPLDFLKRGQDLYDKIESMPIPVIAAMDGHAFGGGLEMAMACHFRFLRDDARVGLTETNLGIMPGYGGTLRLPRLIGRGKALEFILLGQQISAQEALKIGLVHRICSPGQVLESVMEFAEMLKKRPPLAVRNILRLMTMSPSISPEQHLKLEREALVDLFSTKDMIEGMMAFAQKREPNFKGE